MRRYVFIVSTLVLFLIGCQSEEYKNSPSGRLADTKQYEDVNDSKYEDVNDSEKVPLLLNIVFARELLAGRTEISQILASHGTTDNKQEVSDMESKFVALVTEYIGDVKTREIASKRGRDLAMQRRSGADDNSVQIELTIRAIKEAAKHAKLSDELTQEILKPVVSQR